MLERTQYKTALAAGLTAVFLLSTEVVAMPLSDVTGFDVDRDGFIEKGPEARALKGAFARLNGQQQARFGRFLEGGSEKLALSELDFTDLYGELARSCQAPRRFRLAESLAGVSLVHPDIVVLSDKGARFSWNRDNTSGETSWSAKGVFVYAPMSNRCLHTSSPEPLNGTTLTGYAIAPYLSFDGVGSSSTTEPSDLRIGAAIDLQFFGGTFDLQQVQISPFFRTDFEGKAEIYGASLRWTPYKFTSRLNGLQGDAGHNGVDYRLSADAEYLNVAEGGLSGLPSGTEYGWVGVQAGIGYTPAQWNGVRFDLNVDAAYDLINENDAVLYDAGVTIPIGDSGNAALDLRYTYGTTRSNPTTVDGVSANFRIRF